MTIINPNSIAGITSVTAEAGVMNFYKSDGTLAGLQLNGVNFNTTAGVSTFNNVYVGGTITYEDVKNVDSVGIVTARTGIHIDDSITHIGDTNTKIRFPSADTFSVETAGQQNVQVNGTRVLLKSPSGTNTTVRLQHQGNSGYGDIILDRQVNAFIIDNDPSNASNNQSYFSVKNKGTENLRISSGGAVQVNGGAVHLDANGELAVFETDTNLAFTNSSKLCFDFSSNVARIRTSINGSASIRPLAFYTGNDERLRITSAGKLLIGSTSARVESNGFASPLQVEGTSTATSSVIIARNSANTSSSQLIFQKSRGTSVGSNTVIQSGDAVGTIIFEGSDGTNTDPLASIIGACDGTPGTNDVPGRLVFSTTADGAASPTERLRITSNGTVIAGATSVSGGNRSQYSILAAVSNNTSATGHGLFTIQAGSNSSSGNEVAQLCFSDPQGDYAWIQTFADAATGSTDKPGRLVFSTTADGATVPTERLRIDSLGNVSIGGAAPAPHHVGYNGATLHLYQSGSSNVGGELRFTTGNSGHTTTEGGYIAYWTDNNFYCNNKEAGNWLFYTQNVERLRITSDGKVGINRTTPAAPITARRLDAGGTGTSGVIAEFANSSGYGVWFGQSSASGASWGSTTGDFYWCTGGLSSQTERLRIKSDGNVAINSAGTANNLLDIRKDATSVKTHIGTINGTLASMPNSSEYGVSIVGGNVEFGLHKDGSGNYKAILGTYQGSIDIPLVFRTGNRVERLRIDSSGSVEIQPYSSQTSAIVDLADNPIGGTRVAVNSQTMSGDINMPRKGCILAITSFTTFDTYPQPGGTGFVYIDMGNSKIVKVMYTQSGSGADATSDVGTALRGYNGTYDTTVGNYTDSKITIATGSADGTFRIVNRTNNNYTFTCTFL